MKTILRNFIFVLKRFKTASILNIIGLSVAFAVFTVTMMQVYYDYSFNRNFRNSAMIRNFTIQSPDIKYNNMNMPLLNKIGTSFPEIKDYCLLYSSEKEVIKVGDKKYHERFISITSGFPEVFTPEIISGNISDVFSIPHRIMISMSAAKKYFGKENPIGQSILKQDSETPCVVAAVYRDFPKNCMLKNVIYTSLSETSPYNFSFRGYYLIHSEDVPRVVEKLNTRKFLGDEMWGNMNENPKSTKKIELLSLPEVHFLFPEAEYIYFDGTQVMSPKLLWSLLAIGIATLLIAYINFLNFSTALAPIRVKNLNIHVIIGASKNLIKYQLIAEAIFFSFFSFLISILLVYLFKESSFSHFFIADLTLQNNMQVIVPIGIMSILLGILSGLYPAFYITSFQPAMAVNGSVASSQHNVFLRNLLIFLQFFAAITLLITAIFIKKQSDYIRNRPIGINKENIICLPTSSLKNQLPAFSNDLKSNPNIVDWTASSDIPGTISTQLGETFEGTPVMSYWWSVNENFLRFFGVKIMSGRDFNSADSTGIHGIIFNEEFLRKYKMKNIIGKSFGNHSFHYDYQVVGISKDINFLSLRDSIYPMAFSAEKNADFNWQFIKIVNHNIPSTIDAIKHIWQKYTDDDFEMKFLNESIDNLYKNEINLSKLISLFGFIIIIISVMGVYGLITFNTKFKAKEIALRKVNGAYVTEIMVMLNQNIVILLGLAYLAAVPVSYYIVQVWLQQFAYKIPIYWWVFALAGLFIFFVTVITMSVQSYRAATANPTKYLKND